MIIRTNFASAAACLPVFLPAFHQPAVALHFFFSSLNTNPEPISTLGSGRRCTHTGFTRGPHVSVPITTETLGHGRSSAVPGGGSQSPSVISSGGGCSASTSLLRPVCVHLQWVVYCKFLYVPRRAAVWAPPSGSYCSPRCHCGVSEPGKKSPLGSQSVSARGFLNIEMVCSHTYRLQLYWTPSHGTRAKAASKSIYMQESSERNLKKIINNTNL